MDSSEVNFETSELNPPLISGSNPAGDSKSAEQEPKCKRRKDDDNIEKLEERLGRILCCAICFDLPKTAIYQCSNGHLMCAGCFTHLLADARLRDETASCSHCRTTISKDTCSRNLAAEKAVSELPAACRFCLKELPRSQLEYHEMNLCQDRVTECCYSRIGCHWRGPNYQLSTHEESCVYPLKTGAEVIKALDMIDRKKDEELRISTRIYDLLSYENISFNDIQLKPYRADEIMNKLYYETSRFVAFNNQWIVKASVNDNQSDTTKLCDKSLRYQLVLKTKIGGPIMMHYIIVKGPYGDMKVLPQLYHYEFSEGDTESYYQVLPLNDSTECNKIISTKIINCRLLMFQKKMPS